MNFKVKTFKNNSIYESLKQYNKSTNELIIKEKNDWIDFLSQNKERKNKTNSNQNINTNFINKRILKNIKGFDSLIQNSGFNKQLTSGYFLDYSSYVNIFLYFKDDQDLINYVIDTCEARGDNKVTNFNEAINYLANEDVVISNVIELEINENQWKDLIKEYEELVANKKAN